MTKVFVDASVIFAASYSRTGSSRELLRQAIQGQVELVVSQHVLKETERNLAHKAPEALAALRTFLDTVPIQMVANPTPEELQQAATYIHIKDAPVVAAAAKAQADYLATWDRRHFIEDPGVAIKSGLRIVTPDELVGIIRQQDKN